jgi:hypothetical protein
MNTPNQLSDTPRTDLAWAKTFEDDENQYRAGNAATDMRDECATLEIELTALTAERDHWQEIAKAASAEREHNANVAQAIAAERDQLRDQLAAAQQRQAIAIALWDEERKRALREGGRVVEWRDRAELAEAALAAEREKVRMLRAALENLRDEQNGAPLCTREEQWNQAMAKADLALATTEDAK